MTLNRERILTELGDVMNQLQGADCGCMEKIFTPSPAQRIPTMPCQGGCCGCHNTQPAQPMHSMPSLPKSTRHCLGSVNPEQMYNDTHNYLNENLVKPVVQEVYQDLKSLTPENTTVNNPLAQQIINANARSMASNPGASHGYASMPMNPTDIMSKPGMGVAAHMGGMAQNQMGGGGQDTIGQGSFPAVSDNVQRMGDGWVNMMLGDSKKSQMPAMADMPMAGDNMTGDAVYPIASEFQVGSGMPPMVDPNNPNMGQPQNPQGHPLANMAQMAGMAQMPQNMLKNTQQGMSNDNALKEFKKMFPQPNDLGYDPMALAMQMDPKNQQNMHANHVPQNYAKAPETFNNAPRSYVIPPQTYSDHPSSNSYQPYENNNQIYTNQPQTNPDPLQAYANQDAMNYNGNNSKPVNCAHYGNKYSPSLKGVQNGLPLQDQVSNNSFGHQKYQPTPLQQQPQNEAADATADTVAPAAFERSSSPTQRAIKEPIQPVANPVNISFNTLGLPCEVIPEHMIPVPQYSLPQTLSPIPPPVKPIKLGVKSTVSKTALMGMKPVGRQPSKSQLQLIYKKYRGSNSYPNLGGASTPKQSVVVLENAGDAGHIKDASLGQVAGGNVGDGPAPTKKLGEDHNVLTPSASARPRNGLQDDAHTSCTSYFSPKWSFSTDPHVRPHYTRYRYRQRY